ncbi:MAG TPA: M3 family oligoendopeptidase [Flavobacteriales bacterium]|jgi:oligoendopeptidase F|nr:M3 family oligoendopeptidase [Flavobacteriales bacterium]|tara:strand:+ start:973 stop:2694 length:1722 start_codon:yes stop_codon:yes gene_type:complete
MQTTIAIPKRPKRKFVSENLVIDSWGKIKSLFDNLVERKISNANELEKWMLDRSELESVLEEDMAWRYIKMNIDTTDKKLRERFSFWIKEIAPKTAPYSHKLNLKLVESPFLKDLEREKYHIYLRSVNKKIEIFREENIPLFTTMEQKQQEYGAISAKMSIEVNGEKLTMQKAAQLLKSTDRVKREEVYNKISTRRLQDEKALDDLFDELIALRQQIARNTGFDNYRNYMFAAMGRFDYTPKDCFNFHDAIAQEIVPIINSFEQKRKDKLGYTSYKPWDTAVDVDGLAPLNPFEGGAQLTDLSVECFNRLRPYFGECLSTMKAMKHLDLESKNGKAPGGFMYPLYEIGVPFIYMNAVGSQRDLVTMVHEGGHAVHSFLSRDLAITEFKSTPSEVAELASMAMELLSMDHWDVFYKNTDDLKRAKLEQLEKVLETLPWVASIDKFQHWIYTTEHTAQQRKEKWLAISAELGNQILDWEGNEKAHANLWQKQLHLYEVPFYYIEYGMAQLGAIAMWRSYKQLGGQGLDNYMNALKLGYTKTIGEIYETAGIKFDFSADYVKELADFIKDELSKLG